MDKEKPEKQLDTGKASCHLGGESEGLQQGLGPEMFLFYVVTVKYYIRKPLGLGSLKCTFGPPTEFLACLT